VPDCCISIRAKLNDHPEDEMITNRMRRMSKRRQKIELRRQARLVAQAVDLQQIATDQTALAGASGEQPSSHSTQTPEVR
jgi:hypothetical protein